MFKKIIKYFDKLEDRVRSKLSRTPLLYAFIGGFMMVFFWRGVWATSDIIMEKTTGFVSFFFSEPVMLVWSTIVLLLTGLFFSFFMGDRIILSGIKHEKKIEEKTIEEIQQEGSEIKTLSVKIDQMAKDIEEIKNAYMPKSETKEKIQPQTLFQGKKK